MSKDTHAIRMSDHDVPVVMAAFAAQMFAPHHVVSSIMVTNDASVTVPGGFATEKGLWSAVAAAQIVLGTGHRCIVYFSDDSAAGSYHPGIDELPGLLLPELPDDFKAMSQVPEHQVLMADEFGFNDIQALR